MPLPKKIFKIAGCTVLYLIVFDIIGIVVSFILDVLFTLPVRGASAGAFYALWIVLGVFCGLLIYDTAGSWIYPNLKGDWTKEKDAEPAGRLVRATSMAVVIVLGALFGVIFQGTEAGNYFVPDNVPLTIAFFLGVAGGTIVAHNAQSPASKRTA